MYEQDASLELATNNDEFSANAKKMLQAEQTVIDSGLDYVIVRCSGLIGPDRHPARFASRLKQVSRLAEFYQAALKAANLDEELPPIVDVADKRIVSDKLIKAGYKFHYSHTLEAL